MYTMYVGGMVMFFAATVFMHGIHGFHKLVPTPLCFSWIHSKFMRTNQFVGRCNCKLIMYVYESNFCFLVNNLKNDSLHF